MHFSLILFSAALASAYPLQNATVNGNEYDPLSLSLGKRVIESGGCNGVKMRSSKADAGKCWTKRGNEMKPDKEKGWATAYWWDVAKKHTTAQTDITQDGTVQGIRPPTDSDAPYHFEFPTKHDISAQYTCEHIMELQIVGNVLQDEGICQMAEEMTDQAAAKKALLAIRGVANTDANWVYFVNGPAALKGKATEDFCAKSTGDDKNPNAGLQKRPAESTYTDLEWLAMQDYLDKNENISIKTAELVDDKIHEHFPGAPRGKVTEKWKAYLARVKHITAEVKEKVDNEISCAKAAEAASKIAPGSGTRSSPTPHPLLRRALSVLPNTISDFLERRIASNPKKPTVKQPYSCPVPRRPASGTHPAQGTKVKEVPQKTRPKTTAKAKPTAPKTTKPKPTRPKTTLPNSTRPKVTKPKAVSKPPVTTKTKAARKPKPKTTKSAPGPVKPKARIPVKVPILGKKRPRNVE